MSKKYYVTTFTIQVLSEDEPLDNLNLDDLPYQVNSGDCVLHSDTRKSKKVSAKKMAELLNEAGSEPGFFRLE